MIDVNKITSTLAKLPDAQLQQYAQMHKADPYIMALAMSESNRRKEMRSAGQGAQGMQEQPKVVDQMVAEMAPRPAQPMPEDQGIGQLPAGEMNFAGGGIIAFADGGDVERYQDQGLVRPQFIQDIMNLPQRYSEYQQRIREEDERKAESDRRMAEAKRQRLEAQQKTSFANYLFGSPERAAEGQAQLAQMSAPTPAQQQADYLRQQDKLMQGRVPRRMGDEFAGEEQLIAARAAAAPTAAPPAAPRPDATKKSLSGPPATQPAAGLTALQDPAKVYQDILAKQNAQDPAAGDLLELEAQERANAAARRQSILADAERFKDAYKGREGRLAEREADIGKQKGTNTGLAFLNAGLAIMSTPGGLASAIGKGAQVGTAQFAAGLDKIRSAQERLGEARDRLDDLKLNREETTAKEIRDAEDNYRRVGVDAKKRSIDGVRTATGLARADAKNIYDKTMSMAETMYKEQQANVRTDKTVAGMLARTGDTAGNKQDRLKLDGLKTLATTLTNEIKNDPMLILPRNAAIKQAKEAELARVKDQIAQMTGLGTMMPASPAGAGSGLDLSQWGKSQVVNP